MPISSKLGFTQNGYWMKYQSGPVNFDEDNNSIKTPPSIGDVGGAFKEQYGGGGNTNINSGGKSTGGNYQTK